MSCSTTASIFAWNLVSVARASHVARARVRAAATATGSDSSIRGRTDEGRSKRLEKKSRDQQPPRALSHLGGRIVHGRSFWSSSGGVSYKKFVHAFKSLRLYESDWQANLFCEDFCASTSIPDVCIRPIASDRDKSVASQCTVGVCVPRRAHLHAPRTP